MKDEDYIDFCKHPKVNIVTVDCAEAALLTTDVLKHKFVIELDKIVKMAHPSQSDLYFNLVVPWALDHLYFMMHATPIQRAEALLRAIGKWDGDIKKCEESE